MIEEKDSIRCTRNKLSTEKSKRTVIYDDSIQVNIKKIIFDNTFYTEYYN